MERKRMTNNYQDNVQIQIIILFFNAELYITGAKLCEEKYAPKAIEIFLLNKSQGKY